MNQGNKNKQWIWHLITLLFVYLIRYHTVFYHYWDWDEASMMSQAWAMTEGQVLYKDIYQIHPPFQFFIFVPFFLALPVSLAPFAIKVLNIILVYLGALLVRKLIECIYRDFWTANLSALLFIFYVSYYGWAQSSHGEFYTIFPILATAYLILTKEHISTSIATTIGFLWGAAFFIKQIALFDILPLFVVLAWIKHQRSAKIVSFLLLGAAAALFLAALYPLTHGSLKETIGSTLLGNVKTYVAGHEEKVSLFSQLGTVFMGLMSDFFGYHRFLSLIVALGTITLWLISRLKAEAFIPSEYRGPLYCSFLWIASIFLGLALTRRYYPHYLLQLSTPVVIFYSFFVRTIRSALRKPYVVALTLGFIIAGVNIYVKESGNLPEIVRRVKRSEEIADFIKKETVKNDRIFLFQEESLDIYYLSERLSPNGIYMHLDMDSAHTNDLRSERLYRLKLQKNLPTVVVWGTDPIHPPSKDAEAFFDRLVKQHYSLKKEIDGAKLFFLRS